MSSKGIIHGHLIYSNIASSSRPEPYGRVREAGVARGDIIQFYEAHFKYPGGQSWDGRPDHTAVITGVEPDGVLRVVHQNGAGNKRVQSGKYNMAQLAAGQVRIFRAVGESWVGGKLNAKW
jgi:hypothetical protein